MNKEIFEKECPQVSIILIDKTDGFSPTKRETQRIQTLKTIATYV